jgi:hypothetical protein
MTPLVVKTSGEFEFDILEAKKLFPESGKASCVLKRKVAKIAFLSKTSQNVWGIRNFKMPQIQ